MKAPNLCNEHDIQLVLTILKKLKQKKVLLRSYIKAANTKITALGR